MNVTKAKVTHIFPHFFLSLSLNVVLYLDQFPRLKEILLLGLRRGSILEKSSEIGVHITPWICFRG